jgi:hypothetical protein
LELFGSRPWPDLSHGSLGILEYYILERPNESEGLAIRTIKALQTDLTTWREVECGLRKIKKMKNHACLCGSKRRFDKCHPLAFQALKELGQEFKNSS